MNIFDKLLGLTLVADLTESAWWTETVYRGLEQDAGSDENVYDAEPAASVSPADSC